MPRKRSSISGPEEERGRGNPLAALIAIVLIVAVAFIIFTGGGDNVSVEEILDKSAEASAKVTKESFTYEGSLKVSSEFGAVSVPISGEGRIDPKNKRSYMKINLASVGSESELSLQSYAIDDSVYIDSGNGWAKLDVEEGVIWNEKSLSEKVIELAKASGGGSLELVEFAGEESYKVSTSPTLEEIAELFSGIRSGSIIDKTGGKYAKALEREVGGLEFDIWVSATDFIPVKATAFLSVDMNDLNPEGGAVQSEMEIDATIYFDQTTDFSIMLPQTAQNAEVIEF